MIGAENTPLDQTECVQMQAADSGHACLQVAPNAGIAIYATSDSGRSLRRIDRAAEAAGSG